MVKWDSIGFWISLGVEGLDEVLGGGFIKGCVYLVCGGFGMGKIIFGLYFLVVGVWMGECCLFIMFGEFVE